MEKTAQSQTKILMAILGAMVLIFLVLVGAILMAGSDKLQGKPFMFVLFGGGGAFTILGALLGVLAKRWKVEGWFGKFLMIAGFSAAGFLPLSVLHNLFYGVEEAFSHIALIKYPAGFLHAVCFLISVIVCPLLFLVGAVGSVVGFVKKRYLTSSPI